jgi:dUTP pyrophosphatase
MQIKKLNEDAILPRYAHENDAGMDLFSNDNTLLEPNQTETISTGIAIAIPKGNVGLIWDKSGISSKHGIKTLAGVVDSGYRGEIKVVLHNLSNEDLISLPSPATLQEY